jgi:cellobiose phosphorylase
MGTGDWNDGMNRVGEKGKGESIWLGFFLYDVLMKFIHIATLHNDPDFAAQCKTEAEQLRANIEQNGWDGDWYRRAYFDDGTPLGSTSNIECEIDAIAQSWSVLSGAGSHERSVTAMESAISHLVKKDAALIQLLDPPFDKAPIDPGYIKGYVPGVRENGGQYTHSAVWTVMALAKLGDSRRTWELLQMINPLNHGNTAERISIYKVEPYVMAGDVYALPPHTGRGGWTWYTGSAGWMYQLIIESFLGLQTKGNKLSFAPCIPAEWSSFKVHYRFQNTVYHISFNQKDIPGTLIVAIDGAALEDNAVSLVDDGIEHFVEVVLFADLVTENPDKPVHAT